MTESKGEVGGRGGVKVVRGCDWWGLVVGGRSSPQDLPGVRTHKLINRVLMEDLDTQSPRLRPLRPPHLNLLAGPIFQLNDADTDATGISEGL